jgi:hypothetical protein
VTGSPAVHETHPGLSHHPEPAHGPAERLLHWSIAFLVVAQAAVVGLQVVGRLVLRHPIPWTEEIARAALPHSFGGSIRA